jgi:hypothetical protein
MADQIGKRRAEALGLNMSPESLVEIGIHAYYRKLMCKIACEE